MLALLQMPEVKDVLSQRLMVNPVFRNSGQMDALQRAHAMRRRAELHAHIGGSQ